VVALPCKHDHLDRIPVALVPHRNRHNNQSSQPPNKVNNLTMPSGLLTVPLLANIATLNYLVGQSV